MSAEALRVLQDAHITPSIFSLRPDYRALLLVIENIPSGASDTTSEQLLNEAQSTAASLISTTPVTELPHIAAWRQTYKAFGAKPQKIRNSLEALTRRAVTVHGLPRVNRLTDIYNAISVKHQIPFGGEDLDKYEGVPYLTCANGDEEFQTFSGGEPRIECAEKGEPIWCDGKGITCRRWNWRQGPRTALEDKSSRVLFILDALESCSDEALTKAADELEETLKKLSPDVKAARRFLTKADARERS